MVISGVAEKMEKAIASVENHEHAAAQKRVAALEISPDHARAPDIRSRRMGRGPEMGSKSVRDAFMPENGKSVVDIWPAAMLTDFWRRARRRDHGAATCG
jgi:hypothetical protein